MSRRARASRPLLAALLLLAAGCASAAGPVPGGAGGRDHPLAGRIWDVAGRRFIDRPALLDRLARARFVVLGEKHDNPEHHRLQALVVRELAAAARRPVVGFEMLTLDQAPALAQHLARAPGDAAGLGDAVEWGKTGWPDWKLYQPIAEAALAEGLPIIATNLPRRTLEAMRGQGLEALEPVLVRRVGLDRPLDPETRDAMAADIRESHCGYAPEAALDRMIAVQRARDAHMADRLAAAADGRGGVLIAGAGHARKDWAVPAFLARLAPGADVASVAFLEVEEDRREPEAYAARFGGRLPYDYVWFTARLDDEDPCEKFRKSLQRLRERGR